MGAMSAPLFSFHDEPRVLDFIGQFPGKNPSYSVLRKALYREGLPWSQALELVAAPLSHELNGRFVWMRSQVIATQRAPGSVKALWETFDGWHFESVLIQHQSGRTTLCVSSQVGCAMGCTFCATGQQGLVRNLETSEILEQATWAVETLRPRGERLRNVVFMGMGEPLVAMDSVGPALRGLMDQRRFEIAPRYLSLSTCGIGDAIEPFYREFPSVKLAVSLHAPRQDLRDRLMPSCRSWPLDQLLETLDRYSWKTGHKIFLEYIMIDGINDGPRESAELVNLLRGRLTHVNLIPCNTPNPRGWTPSNRASLDAFQKVLAEAGIPSTVRHSAGESIAAACGQLAGKAPSGNRRGRASSAEEANRN